VVIYFPLLVFLHLCTCGIERLYLPCLVELTNYAVAVSAVT